MTSFTDSPTIELNEQFADGSKIISGTLALVSGNDQGTMDLTAYLNNIKHVTQTLILKSGAEVAVATRDWTTNKGKLALTFTNPAAGATLYFTVVGD